MMPLVEMSTLVHFFELFLAHPLVHVFFIVVNELGVISFAAVFDAEHVLVPKENVDHVFSLLGVVDEDLDSFIVVLVDVDCLVVYFGDIELVHDANCEAVKRMPVVDPSLPDPKVDDHVEKVVDIWVLWLCSTLTKNGSNLHGLFLWGERDFLSHLFRVWLFKALLQSNSEVNRVLFLSRFDVEWVDVESIFSDFLDMHLMIGNSGDLVNTLSSGWIFLDKATRHDKVQGNIMLSLVLDFGVSNSLQDVMWDLLFHIVPRD